MIIETENRIGRKKIIDILLCIIPPCISILTRLPTVLVTEFSVFFFLLSRPDLSMLNNIIVSLFVLIRFDMLWLDLWIFLSDPLLRTSLSPNSLFRDEILKIFQCLIEWIYPRNLVFHILSAFTFFLIFITLFHIISPPLPAILFPYWAGFLHPPILSLFSTPPPPPPPPPPPVFLF